MAESDLTIGKIFLVLERYPFNAIRRVLQGKEKTTASIVYETIWSWFLRYFDEDKAGVMEAIQKGEYARKLMNPNGKKDISYVEALALNPSLLCQDGFEEALNYCKLDEPTMRSMIVDFKGLGIRVRPSFAAKDITCAIKDHLECVIARKKKASSPPEGDDRSLFGYTSYDGWLSL